MALIDALAQLNKQEDKKMQSLLEAAKAYEPKQTKNIADLDVVPVDIPIEQEVFNDNEGKEFSIKVITVNGEKFRVPTSVLKQLKEHTAENPNLKKFKVKKSGTGLKTDYTVIPLM